LRLTLVVVQSGLGISGTLFGINIGVTEATTLTGDSMKTMLAILFHAKGFKDKDKSSSFCLNGPCSVIKSLKEANLKKRFEPDSCWTKRTDQTRASRAAVGPERQRIHPQSTGSNSQHTGVARNIQITVFIYDPYFHIFCIKLT
jgi:hypothetical protein